MRYTVAVGFDEAGQRYYTQSSDLPGLNIEADTFDEFMQSAAEVAGVLLESSQGAMLKFERDAGLSKAF